MERIKVGAYDRLVYGAHFSNVDCVTQRKMRLYRTVPIIPGSPLPDQWLERIIGSQVSYFASIFPHCDDLDELVIEGWLAVAELLKDATDAKKLPAKARRAVYRALYRYATWRGWRLRGGRWHKVETTD